MVNSERGIGSRGEGVQIGHSYRPPPKTPLGRGRWHAKGVTDKKEYSVSSGLQTPPLAQVSRPEPNSSIWLHLQMIKKAFPE